MALTPSSEVSIRNAAPNRGRLGTDLAEALIKVLRTTGTAGEVPTPHVILVSTVTATAASHIAVASACRLYGAYVNSPSAAALGSIVRFYDGASVSVAGVKVAAGATAGVLFLAGADGAGIPIATDLRVFAAKPADGTTTPDSGDNPDVTLIVGY